MSDFSHEMGDHRACPICLSTMGAHTRSCPILRADMRTTGTGAVAPADVDLVNHPPHYKRGGIETIDVIEAWGLGFHLGNALKYISRAGHKSAAAELEDLKKARWYLDREIARRERTP